VVGISTTLTNVLLSSISSSPFTLASFAISPADAAIPCLYRISAFGDMNIPGSGTAQNAYWRGQFYGQGSSDTRMGQVLMTPNAGYSWWMNFTVLVHGGSMAAANSRFLLNGAWSIYGQNLNPQQVGQITMPLVTQTVSPAAVNLNNAGTIALQAWWAGSSPAASGHTLRCFGAWLERMRVT